MIGRPDEAEDSPVLDFRRHSRQNPSIHLI